MTARSTLLAALATLVLIPVASRVDARAPQTPPPPPAPAVVPEPPEAPEPPAPPAHPRHKHKTIVDGDRVIAADGDRVIVWDDGQDEPDVVVEGAGHEWPGHFEFDFPDRGRGYIGMRPIEMTPELRQHFGAPKDAGVLVGSVDADGPAAKAGLQVGDVVTSADGERVDSTRDLVRAIRRQKEGAKVKLEVFRGRAKRDLTVTVGKRSEDVEIGELDRRFKDWGKAFEKIGPRVEKRLRELPDFDFHGIQERLKDVEQRLKDLEERLKK